MSIPLDLVKRVGEPPRVVLCESFDPRILRAAHVLNQHNFARIVLLGNYEDLERLAVGYRADLRGMEIIDYEAAGMQKDIRSRLAELGDIPALDPTDPVVAGAWAVTSGLADAVIAGAATRPPHVMRVYLNVLGMSDNCKTMSGMSLVAFDDLEFIRTPAVGMADVSVVPEPTVEQLTDIAIQSAANYERISGQTPRVAFLSFSTMGSSDHPAARRIAEAAKLTKKLKPGLAAEGELQVDAALIPSAAGVKAAKSSVAGSANVLIFPSLEAGNIAMKIFQQICHRRVLGPILQGLKYPATYVPRASSAEDIVDQVRLMTS